MFVKMCQKISYLLILASVLQGELSKSIFEAMSGGQTEAWEKIKISIFE